MGVNALVCTSEEFTELEIAQIAHTILAKGLLRMNYDSRFRLAGLFPEERQIAFGTSSEANWGQSCELNSLSETVFATQATPSNEKA